MISKQSLIAANRFGLGASAADISNIGQDPKQWLTRQIKPRHSLPKSFKTQDSSQKILKAVYDSRQIKGEDAKKDARKILRKHFDHSLSQRLAHQVRTETPFAERLVMFWSNHFTVSRTRGLIGPAIPAYEAEAIRPFVFKRFEDMLINVVQHPCMLIYLDNISSIGPNSILGRRRDKDLNENLAREVLELHTLGARGGYTQTDVTNFAKVLTGWTVLRKTGRSKKAKTGLQKLGSFSFNEKVHEPGPQTLLGETFKQNGKGQGLQALKMLARHPSTANYIATKLVQHFVNDSPAPQDVKKLANVFTKTGGDLAAVSKALVNLESAWSQTGSKIKTPEDMMISAMRAVHRGRTVTMPRKKLLQPALKSMGQETFHAPSPAGWPDEGERWMAPEALTHRLEWVRAFSRQSPADIMPLDVFNKTIAPFASDLAIKMIENAPSRQEGLALIFSSPAFQRR